MINQSIFKSYDVRGIYPSELNEQAAYAVGRAFVKLIAAKNPSKPLRAISVVVGHDARLSSPTLFKALTQGLLAEGAKVTTIGQTPTEGVYFAVASYEFDAGIMITASHNPKDYNGFKMITRNGKDLNIIRGLDLLSIIEETDFESKDIEIPQKDILQDYKNYIFNLFDFSTIKKFKVVVDASNGVASHMFSNVALPVEIVPLNFEPDGNFPNHAPNPLEPGASDQIKEVIKKYGADFGFMFDADADRIFLVDEQGSMVPADLVLIILAKYCLEKSPGAGIAYNAVCSKSVAEFVTQYGGVPIRTQVGAVNVRDGLLKNNGVVGGEISAHYCFRDYFYMDSGLIALLAILQIFSQDGRKVSEIVKDLMVYFKSAELNFKIEDKEKVLNRVKEKYADGKQDYLDGVTVEYKDWWFNVRPSNTEPLLRISLLEARTKELLEEKKEELIKFVTQ